MTHELITPDAPYARSLVKLLLRDDGPRADELNALLLRARQAPHRSASVVEIAHFIAHHDTRERGDVVSALANSIAASFPAPPFHPRKILAISRRPDFINAIRKLDRSLTDEVCRSRLGMTRPTLMQRLEDAVSAFLMTARLAVDHKALIDSFVESLPIDAELRAEEFADSFIEQIARLGWLLPAEKPILRQRKRFIVLHAVAIMHGSILRLPDGRRAPLVVAADRFDKLVVVAKLPVPGRQVHLADVPMLRTEEKAGEACTLDLREELGRTHEPIEVARGGLAFRH